MTGGEGDGSSPLPILLALGVALVVLAIVGFTWFFDRRPPGEDVMVGRAAVGQNDALQRDSYPDFRKYTCAAQQGVEAEVLAGQQKSRAAHGARYVDDITEVKIDGEDFLIMKESDILGVIEGAAEPAEKTARKAA